MGQRGRISDAALEAEVNRPKDAPRKPKGLSREASIEWERVTSMLAERRLLDRLDEAGLHDYLVCWQRLKECEREITSKGLTVETDRGVVKNPACTLATQYRTALLNWSKELGLTLASRLRMQVEKNLAADVIAPDPYGMLD